MQIENVGDVESTPDPQVSTLTASGQIVSTQATGTAPLVIASTTNVPNLNASSLNGATFAAPGAIGGGTASTGAFTTLTLGAGTALTKWVVYTPSLTPSSVAANTSAEEAFAGITGLTTADKVLVNGPAPTAGTGIVNARVSAANTLALTFANNTGGALTPASGTYAIIAFRS